MYLESFVCQRFGEKTLAITITTTITNLCHIVLVENIIICNLFIHKAYESIRTMQFESIRTMQLIFCVTGTSRTFNLWGKNISIKTTTTKLATMYW